MFKYFSQTPDDIREMLARAGVGSLESLYDDVPEELRLKGDYDLPSSMSELEVRQYFEELARKNVKLSCFAGGGVYDKYVPAIIPALTSRQEFLTSYTPYQAEISQGTLHYIFEYQTMMSRLTGLPVSNASMYDGTTATAEAMLMAVASSRKANKVLLSSTLDDKTARVVETYARFHGVEIEMVGETGGVTDRADLEAKLAAGGVAGVVVQQPNKYGIVEDFDGLAGLCHAQKSLLVVNSIAADLALLKTPGEWGADIAVGEGQSLGIPMNYGGPYIGYMCCTEKLMRKMPGRIVGQTVDNRGQRAFVLTLQAREQHIRRQKATSNICSNESLMALWVTIYLATMGRQGVKDAAQLSMDGAHYLCGQLIASPRFRLKYNQPFFNEFCLTYDGDVELLQARAQRAGFMAGLKMDEHTIMLAVTEKHTRTEIDRLVNVLLQETEK